MMTRREALLAAAAATPLPLTALAQDDGVDEPADRAFVMAAGMTEQEADCWELAGKLAGQMFELPEQHPMDNHEIAHAIHVVQNKLLARVTYRAYLDHAKQHGS